MRKPRLILLGLIATTTSLIASIGMSVAWYANGAYLRTSDVNVSLTSDPQLGLSTTYSSSIKDYHFGEFPYEELPKMKSGFSEQYESGEEVEVTENGFVPVSSMFSDDWVGKTDSNGNLLDPEFCRDYKRATIYETDSYRKTKKAISGFFMVPLYLFSDHDMYVTIDSSDSIFAPNLKANEEAADLLATKKKDKTKEEYLTALNKIVNSLRVSIYDCESESYWIIDPTKGETTTYLCGTLDLDASKEFDYYYDEEHDDYREYFFGEYDDSSEIVYKTNSDYVEINEYNAFNAHHAGGVKAVDMDYYIQNGLAKAEESYTQDQISKMDLIALKNHVPHKIVMSIYIEGWDRDNTAVSALGAFFASVQFKFTRPYFSN